MSLKVSYIRTTRAEMIITTCNTDRYSSVYGTNRQIDQAVARLRNMLGESKSASVLGHQAVRWDCRALLTRKVSSEMNLGALEGIIVRRLGAN